MEVYPPLYCSLTEGKNTVCRQVIRNLRHDTMQVSWLFSRFYLSHTLHFHTSCHSFRRSIACLMPMATDVTLFLTAESADERLDAETGRVPSLDSRNPPLSSTDCQRDWMNEFSSSASNRMTTCRRLFTRMRKPSLQAKRASMSSICIGLKNRW